MEKRNELLPAILKKFKEHGVENEQIKLLHVRDSADQPKDIWNDYLIFIDNQNNVWVSQGTTDPGNIAYKKHPEGAAHMLLGFHKNIWVMDIHAANNKNFAHEALCSRPQFGCFPVKFWRDANKNRIYDSNDQLSTKYVGINCHRASKWNNALTIGPYSEGCQVRRIATDHEFMMQELKKFDCVKNSLIGKRYAYRFSCLLIEKIEFNEINK